MANDKRVIVKAPASSANMGPGFDCLGIALDIWNTVEVAPAADGEPSIAISGHGERDLPRDETNLVWSSLARAFDAAGETMPPLSIKCRNEIPTARGLGSSSAALVGGLTAGNALCGYPLSKDDLFQIAADIEGHPDNVAPAIYGGMRIAVSDGDRVASAPVAVPDSLTAALYIPDSPMPTEEARGLLADDVTRADAVFNMGRVALLVRAMESGDLSSLRLATQDRLHQPARSKLFFPMNNIIRAALSAGALGAFLSGAGPTVLALATEKQFTIGYEMADAAAKSGLEGDVRITRPTPLGARVL